MMKDFVNFSGTAAGTKVVLDVATSAERGRSRSKKPKRLHARAIKRIHDSKSGDLVGWLYEWNTGSVVPRWIAGARKDVYYE